MWPNRCEYLRYEFRKLECIWASTTRTGLLRELNSRLLPPKGKIIPLDQAAAFAFPVILLTFGRSLEYRWINTFLNQAVQEPFTFTACLLTQQPSPGSTFFQVSIPKSSKNPSEIVELWSVYVVGRNSGVLCSGSVASELPIDIVFATNSWTETWHLLFKCRCYERVNAQLTELLYSPISRVTNGIEPSIFLTLVRDALSSSSIEISIHIREVSRYLASSGYDEISTKLFSVYIQHW